MTTARERQQINRREAKALIDEHREAAAQTRATRLVHDDIRAKHRSHPEQSRVEPDSVPGRRYAQWLRDLDQMKREGR